MHNLRRRGALTLAGLLWSLAAPALAHVTVSAPGARPGATDVELTFRVPNESEGANTVALSVQLPTDTPIAGVQVQATPGWTVSLTTTKLATPIETDDGEVHEVVSAIDWRVQPPAQGVAPGQYQQFTVLAGLLPKVDALTFPTVQTYSDGTTVRWTQVAAPGTSAEPDHPAPVLQLGAPAASSPGPSVSAATHTAGAAPTGRSSTPALLVAIAGLVVAIAALVLGGLAMFGNKTGAAP